MYEYAKSRIIHNGEKSDFFACKMGVRQGENLSPALFSVFLNDLQDYLEQKDIVGLKSISYDLENELTVFLKIFLLLYADDTVLLSENSNDLQSMLNEFYNYCTEWNLKINTNKTKVMIFCRGRMPNNLNFFINGYKIEIVKEYKYLGIFFSRSGSFLATRKHLKEQATKAMYGVIKKSRQNNLSVECQLDLFDKIVLPILLYGSEIWGFENLDLLERVHVQFCKIILCLKQSTPNMIVYAELGRYPIVLNAKLRMVNFLGRILNGKENKNMCFIT